MHPEIAYRDFLAAELAKIDADRSRVAMLLEAVSQRIASRNQSSPAITAELTAGVPRKGDADDDFVVKPKMTAARRVIAALEAAGRPLDADEILRLVPEHSPNTIRFVLSTETGADKALRKVGKRPSKWTTADKSSAREA